MYNQNSSLHCTPPKSIVLHSHTTKNLYSHSPYNYPTLQSTIIHPNEVHDIAYSSFRFGNVISPRIIAAILLGVLFIHRPKNNARLVNLSQAEQKLVCREWYRLIIK